MSKTKKTEVVAILCADLHLQHKPPIWRSAEDDWYEAMRRPLKEIEDLSRIHNCPVIIAGDIFDRWNACPELINFALEYLPSRCFTIPGQHDLPNHQHEDIQRSAYWTLFKAGKTLRCAGAYIDDMSIYLQGFPYGTPLKHCRPVREKIISIAVCHEYKWIKGASFEGAEQNNLFKRPRLEGSRWKGYDVVVYGDNHKPWNEVHGQTVIWNCGSVMRRHSDEIDHKPRVGLLKSDGSIKSHCLDISQDKHLTVEQVQDVVEEDFDMSKMAEVMNQLGKAGIDFAQAIKNYERLKKVKPEVMDVLMRAMEGTL